MKIKSFRQTWTERTDGRTNISISWAPVEAKNQQAQENWQHGDWPQLQVSWIKWIMMMSWEKDLSQFSFLNICVMLERHQEIPQGETHLQYVLIVQRKKIFWEIDKTSWSTNNQHYPLTKWRWQNLDSGWICLTFQVIYLCLEFFLPSSE